MHNSTDFSFSSSKRRSTENTINESHMLINYSNNSLSSNLAEELRRIVDSTAHQFSHHPVSFDSISIYYIHQREQSLCSFKSPVTNSYSFLTSQNFLRRNQKIRRINKILHWRKNKHCFLQIRRQFKTALRKKLRVFFGRNRG